MKEPTEPSKEDCCSSGCNPCIFDVYEKQLILYKRFLEGGDILEEKLVKNSISQIKYTEFIVVENIKLCEQHHLILFEMKTESNTRVFWNPGNHFLVKYTSGNVSCSRAYTPLKQHVKGASGFSVIVKRYNQGVVSQYLCDLELGEITLWRGPYGMYEIVPNKFDRIIMIAQGTGITPFFSIIESILTNEDDMTKLILLYCCQSKEQILLREELYLWKQYWNFTYKIFLNNGVEGDMYKYLEPIVHLKLDRLNLLPLLPCSIKDQILLCGSAQFMDQFNDTLSNEYGFKNIFLF